ncbi:MAG: hypothetical protein KKB50_13635, partial [Planctomycetes bacterium]|nr:hypothetical protein [Planctomycetota bacterium]
MNIALFEDAGYERLLPLTWLRAGCELRCGCDRLLDKVGPRLGGKVVRVWTREAIRSVVTERLDLPAPAPKKDWCLLSARALVTEATSPPPMGVAWQRNGELVGVRVPAEDVQHLEPEFFFDEVAVAGWLAGFRIMPPPPAVGLINYPWELPLANGDEIRRQCRAG